MKKLMMSAALLGLVSLTNFDVLAKPSAYAVETVKEQGKEPIKPEELPEAVKKTLANAPYDEWETASAFSVTTDDGKQYYEINLRKGETDVTIVKLDKEGNPVE